MLNNKEILTLKKGKTVVCLFLILICFFAFTVYANSVKDFVYRICASYVNTEPDNLVFYKYKVFGTENSFKKNLSQYIGEEKNFLKSKNEFAVVKIKGGYSVERKADYILIKDDTVPDLNAEIYIAKNFDIGNNSLPLKTVVLLLQKALTTIVCVLFLIAFTVCFFKISRYLLIKKTNRGALGIKTFCKG